jgi:Domain of unknown function (DUF5666)
MKEENKQSKVSSANKYIVPIVLLIVGLGGGFFAGMKYQQTKSPSSQFFGGGMRRFGGMGNGGGMMGFRPVAGEILSMDDKSVTVKMPDGSSKIVILTDKTTFSKTETGSKSDLKVGAQIAVFGAANSDGSVTATNLQLNPMFRSPNQ